MSSIWWIRRDLRLQDNLTLKKALENPPVLPVFILDPVLLNTAPERRLNFLFRNLHELDQDLKTRGSKLIIRTGKPVEVLERLLSESGADQIYAEEDFTPYARLRSVLVGSYLPLKLVQGQLGLHPLAALKANGKPYRVFTPFKRNWLALFPVIDPIPIPKHIPSFQDFDSDLLPSGDDEAFFPAGEETARRRLEIFIKKKVEFYHLNRDRMDLEGTSDLSPYIRFGVLGLRTALSQSMQILENESNHKDVQGVETWLNELIWREFYIHIMFHFPESRTQNFRSMYDRLPWRNEISDFEAWKEGLTGFPVVDAAMRQLKQTGRMHNRARMISASFLVKDLLIDWRWGEKWFRENLLDGDLAVNNGSWQWVAGTGTDSAPFFRIFNPIRQGEKYDPTGKYIRTWVPELADLDAKVIHDPWKKRVKISGYPKPIIDHKFARERAILAFQIAKENYYPAPLFLE